MIKATSVIHSHELPADTVTLSYDDRHRRRLVFTCDNGLTFLLDLPKTTELQHGNDLLLEDGRHVRVVAAKERLMKVTTKNALHLLTIAWHIGNRHLPCQFSEKCLILRYDHVISDMLHKLGASVENFEASLVFIIP